MKDRSSSAIDCYGVIRLRSFCFIVYLAFTVLAQANKVYQTPAAFVNEQFRGKPPKVSVINISGEMKARLSQMNGYSYRQTRVRYWASGGKSVWILEDIGKTRPITTGYVVSNGVISLVKVLTYRESHGDEVARTFFTKQFRKVSMKSNFRLTKRPRNIAGATLSVRSLTRMARVALYLDKQLKS